MIENEAMTVRNYLFASEVDLLCLFMVVEWWWSGYGMGRRRAVTGSGLDARSINKVDCLGCICVFGQRLENRVLLPFDYMI